MSGPLRRLGRRLALEQHAARHRQAVTAQQDFSVELG
jgi:hypothetical protein